MEKDSSEFSGINLERICMRKRTTYELLMTTLGGGVLLINRKLRVKDEVL